MNTNMNSVQTIHERNMQALREFYPELAQRIESSRPGNRFEWVLAGQRKELNIKDKQTGLLYYAADDPVADVHEQIQVLKLKNVRLAIFLGMGLGIELLYFLQFYALQQKTDYVLVIEKELDIFRLALQKVDLVKVISNPWIKLMVGLEEENFYTQMQDYLKEGNRYLLLKAVKPIYHISALRLNKDYYLLAMQKFREASAYIMNYYGNDPYDSLVGIENMLDNLKVILENPGINLLFNKFEGRPGIVVASGPSLNKNKHLLEGLQDKAVIIAVDSALRILADMEYKPHLVTSLERVPRTAELLSGFSPEQLEDVFLSACPVIPKEAYEGYLGPKVIVYRNFDHFRWLEIDKGIVDVKMSAGNMAFKLAEVLGCDPIILIGQDLAFSREGDTHARGVHGNTEGIDQTIFTDGGRIFEVMGNDGLPIRSNEGWQMFLKAYEVDVAGYKGTCINCTEGGAYIQGTQLMPFQEAIDQFIGEEFYPRERIKEALSVFNAQEAGEDVERVIALIDTTIADLNKIISDCKKGIAAGELYQEELRRCLHDAEGLKNLSKPLMEMAQEIVVYKGQFSQMHNTFQLFFAHVFQSYTIQFEIEMSSLADKYDYQEQATAEMLLRHKEWYAVMADIAGICIGSLQNSQTKLLESRSA